MTNEQAVRWLKDLLKSDLPMEQYQKALEKGIEALEPKWIPISERLPENSGNYLITYCLQDKIETQEAVYFKDEEEDKWFDITDIEITLAVVAWMPLPTPYEPQESEE